MSSQSKGRKIGQQRRVAPMRGIARVRTRACLPHTVVVTCHSHRCGGEIVDWEVRNADPYLHQQSLNAISLARMPRRVRREEEAHSGSKRRGEWTPLTMFPPHLLYVAYPPSALS
jgi:hypothetical protein